MILVMNYYTKVFGILSNETRLNILEWLKNPEEEFKETNLMVNSDESIKHMLETKGGICVSNITARSGMAQSTISKYLKDLESIDLLISERHEKWTYYRRNEKQIKSIFSALAKEL